MVPLKPNELRRDVLRLPLSADHNPAHAVVSPGMRNHDWLDDTTDDRWAFNLRAALSARAPRRRAAA